MKYSLFGDDTLALRFRKQEIIEKFVASHPGSQILHFDVSDGQLIELQRLEEEIGPSLFEIPKILIAEGMGGIYEDNTERIGQLVATASSADIIFVEARKIAKTDAFLKLLKK